MTIKAHFKRKAKVWEFTWDEKASGWLYRTRTNTYQVFIEDGPSPDIWVGRKITQFHGYENRKQIWSNIWVTCESSLGITHLEIGRAKVHFRQDWRCKRPDE